MSLMDYHRRLMCPDVWKSDELGLRQSARRALESQMSSRFPKAVAVYLTGDLAGHYYHEGSDLDVLIQVKEEDLNKYEKDVQLASGYFLPNTDHPVRFFLVAEDTSPEALASSFGPLFDLGMGTWYGKRVTDRTEMARVDAVLQRIKWKLYKAKGYLDLYPYDWKVVKAAFELLDVSDREAVLYELRQLVHRLRKNISGVAKSYNSERVWKMADSFDKGLDEDPTDNFVEEQLASDRLPIPLAASIINKFRYEDILEELEMADDKIRKVRGDKEREKKEVTLPTTASVEESPPFIMVGDQLYRMAGEATKRFLWDRLDAMVNLIVINSGGYGKALDTMYKVFSHILDKSRYVQTGARRRRIVLRLYRKYYRHIEDA